MSDLKDQIASVTATEPLPVIEPVVQQPEVTSPASGTGNQTGDSGDDRPLKNFQAEFTRKLQQQEQAARERFDRIEQLLTQRNAAPTVAPAAPAQTLNTMSVAELETALGSPQLTLQQRAIVESELRTRVASKVANDTIQTYERQRVENQDREEATREALDLYPILRPGNEDSPFYRAVDAELTRRRNTYGKNPTDILDAANRVAKRMNVQSAARPFGGGYVAGGRTGAPAQGQVEETISDASFNKMAEKYSRALPRKSDGTQRQFNAENIKARARQYTERFGGGR